MPRDPEQQATIDFLADKAAYGVDGSVERIDTHASVLFLVGDRVYKLKRAIAFSYLDYTTVEKRKQACRRELALNRRTAPDLYLDVRAVRRSGDGTLSLAGNDTPIDWVVVMRRFEQEHQLDHLAKTGALTPALMRSLADAIADFHAGAEACDAHGTRQDWDAIIDGNLRNLQRTHAGDAAAIQALTARTRDALGRQQDRLEARRRRGLVRRGHGDLHLRNICLWHGKPTLFDAIDFDESLLCIDTLYDLAFLLMDLDHRRFRALANIVFNRYFDRSGDDHLDGLAALPLFLSVRAAIRAHVDRAVAARQEDAREAADERSQADAYLAQAMRLLDPIPPVLVAVGGLSGSGKSTVAAGLAPDFSPRPGARVIRSDVMRKRMFGKAPEEKLPQEAYAASVSDTVFAQMRDAASQVLAAGYSAILDATYMDERERKEAAAVAAQAGVPFVGIWLDADAGRLRDRVAARRGDASDATAAVVASQLDADLGTIDWARIDASGDAAATLASTARLLAPAFNAARS